MLFLEEKGPSVRLTVAVGTLVAGEAAGFAVRGLVDVWMWIGFFLLVGSLAAYGWGGRRWGCVALFVFGAVLALRTEAELKGVLEENAGLYGPRPALAVPVEGDVNRWRPKKSGNDLNVDFLSHLGPMPLKVVMPVARGGRVPQVGETWLVEGWISRPQDKANRYGRRMLWVPEAKRAFCAKDVGRDDVCAGWNAIREDLAWRSAVGLSWCPDIAALNRAILLGLRSGLPKDRKRAFVDAGTIHVFAISGLHVMVVAWLLNTGISFLGLSQRTRGVVCLPLVWAYVVLTGARPSAVRAATMASFYLVAPVFGRRPDSLAAWAVTAMGVYGLSPERLFDLGCTFSFVVMFGIVLWCHWARHFRPWFGEENAWRRWVGNFGVSLAAWVAGVPIAAHAFGRFTPGGLLANIVVLVCAQKMVKVGVGGLLTSFVCLPLAALLNNVAAVLTCGMSWVSEWVAVLPFSSFTVEPWPVSVCGLWYAGWGMALCCLGVVLPRRERVSRNWWR